MKKGKNRHKQHSIKTIIETRKQQKSTQKNLKPKSYTIIETIIGRYIKMFHVKHINRSI